MILNKLSHEDLSVGTELLCLDEGAREVIYTAGKTYVVETVKIGSIWPYRLSSDISICRPFCLTDLNHSFIEPTFVPLSFLTGEELFLFRVSNKIPKRFYENTEGE